MSIVDKILRSSNSEVIRTFASKEEAQRRRDICFGDSQYLPCEFLNEKNGKCKECGCPMDKKVDYDTIAKRKVTCPKNKW
tara:strand:- start:8239 stop:8478 length:240 start_codon:yes stop_codon:yes gene_type:complete